MFTGLVETTGTIAAVTDQPPGKRFSIDAGFVAEGASIGDSISINGCCLTVIAVDRAKLDFEAGEETLSRTNLGELSVGSIVNLERSLAVGDRLGGHYVTGHIDAIGASWSVVMIRLGLICVFRCPIDLHLKSPRKGASRSTESA